MSVYTINPAFLTVRQWCDFMTPNLEKFGNLGRLSDDEKWQQWGAELLNFPALHGSIVPDPYQFTDWRAWAARLCQTLSEMP